MIKTFEKVGIDRVNIPQYNVKNIHDNPKANIFSDEKLRGSPL